MSWPLAGRRGAVALLHRKAGGVEGNDLVAVHAHLVVWSPAVAAAGVVNLELERCWAFICPTLNLRAGRLQLTAAKAILHGVHDRVLLHERQAGHATYDADKAEHGGLHCSGSCV